jgi:pyruvate dehydrogenase E2 component (dihydrolipoamide acetyltransferase)
MRQAIARRMAAAKREIPHYYVTMSVDMTAAQAFRRQLNAALPEEAQLTVTDLLVKACALALERHPRFNMAYTDEGLRRREAINIGIAVALEDGLVAPAVLDCRGKSLGALAREAHDLAQRARGGRLRPAELSEGTFTISNLGMYGVETLIAIIQPEQSAILGVGAVEPRPVVRDGQVVVREMMTLALSADHRVTDGAEGARFLAEIKDLLEHPERLVL